MLLIILLIHPMLLQLQRVLLTIDYLAENHCHCYKCKQAMYDEKRSLIVFLHMTNGLAFLKILPNEYVKHCNALCHNIRLLTDEINDYLD